MKGGWLERLIPNLAPSTICLTVCERACLLACISLFFLMGQEKSVHTGTWGSNYSENIFVI